MKTIVLDRESNVKEVKTTLKKNGVSWGDEIVISDREKSGIMIAVIAIVLYTIFNQKKRRVEDGARILESISSLESKKLKQSVEDNFGVKIKYESSKRNNFKKLLLSAPVFDEDQIKSIEDASKQIGKWGQE